MNNIEIIDNFLDSSSFEELKNKLYSQQMFWTYSDILTKDNFARKDCLLLPFITLRKLLTLNDRKN